MTSHSIEGLSDGGLREDQIKHMVSRFLGWRLPENFTPDAGISFKAEFNEGTRWPMKHEPVGTNLFSADQAEAMVRHMIEGFPLSAAPERVEGGGWEGSSSSSPSPAASAKSQPNGKHQVYEARLQLQDHQQQLDADGVMVGVSREALGILLKHFSEAWNELHCCDDVALSEGLVGGIADLCAQRDYWRGLVPPRPLSDSASICERCGSVSYTGRFCSLDCAWVDGGDGVPVHSSLPPAEPESQASPPIGAEGGRDGLAGDSGCGEGTQEPSPSGAQSDDGRGGA